jgi:hypothetical protein
MQQNLTPLPGFSREEQMELEAVAEIGFSEENELHSKYTFDENYSAKALGILFHVITTDAHISAESLSKYFKDGESSIGAGLKQLRDAGLLELVVQRMPNGTFIKTTKVTSDGHALFASLLAKLSTTNSHFFELFYNHPAQFPVAIGTFLPPEHQRNYSVVTPDGFGATYANSENERPSEQEIIKRKNEKDRLEWKLKQEKKGRAQFKARSSKPNKETWTPTDMSFEFADRIQEYWHIEPWRVTKTRFRQILADYRRKFNTNGRIEFIMMNYFFESEEISKFTDANYIMMRFFYRYSRLLTFVESRGYLKSENEAIEDFKKELEKSQKSWEWLDSALSESEFSAENESLLAQNQYLKKQRELDFATGIITKEELELELGKISPDS